MPGWSWRGREPMNCELDEWSENEVMRVTRREVGWKGVWTRLRMREVKSEERLAEGTGDNVDRSHAKSGEKVTGCKETQMRDRSHAMRERKQDGWRSGPGPFAWVTREIRDCSS